MGKREPDKIRRFHLIESNAIQRLSFVGMHNISMYRRMIQLIGILAMQFGGQNGFTNMNGEILSENVVLNAIMIGKTNIL